MRIAHPMALKPGECYVVLGPSPRPPHCTVVLCRTTDWATVEAERLISPARWVEIGFTNPQKALIDILKEQT